MKSVDDRKGTVTIRGVNKNEEGQKQVQKVEVDSQNVETVKHVEKKLIHKGVQRQERHPLDGRPLGQCPKSGHGGKYTWEGPGDMIESELDPIPAAIDENDPNYVDEEAEQEDTERIVGKKA